MMLVKDLIQMSQTNSLKPFGIDEEECRLKKAETLNWLNQGAPGLDEGMYEILLQFNSVDGVVTRWCCSGHEHEGGDLKSFYVMFTLTESGLQWIEHWFKLFMVKLLNEMPDITHFVEMSKTYRLKRDERMHEVVVFKARHLQCVEQHNLFLELVKNSFNLGSLSV